MSHLVGLDIGFSERSRTNAIADYRDGELRLRRLSVAERNEAIASLTDVDVIAIDAPILPASASVELARRAEVAFSRGLFQKRCKPGMSHVGGTGRQLREHGGLAARLASQSATDRSRQDLPRVIAGSNVVEAFPNAFLGVVVDELHYLSQPKLRRGGKFDWLYDCWIDDDKFDIAAKAASLEPNVAAECRAEKDHEKRAALVCLLTAAFVSADHFVAVGHAECGYFFLPPQSLWAGWAWNALVTNQSRDHELRVCNRLR